MNDITFCVLACAKNEKYSARLKDFVESYGFKLNNQDIGVKFVFLVDDEPRPDFLPHDYDWYNCPNTPLSCRFLNFIKCTDIDSKWIMQVDDDSSTDIDKTCELLDQFYDHQDPMILMGGRNTDLELSQQNIVRAMKFENFLFGSKNISTFDTTPYFIHAWEPSIISTAGVKKIKEWNRLQEYYDLCIKYRPGFGDQTPYVAAKIAKVPIVECLFMSPFNKSTDYSATKKDGRFSHIHYITDKWPGFDSFKARMRIAKKLDPDDKLPKEDMWEFWGGAPGSENYYGMLILNKDGTIGIYQNDNESFWESKGDSITLFNKKREATSVLKKVGEKEFVGTYIANRNTIHRLIGI